MRQDWGSRTGHRLPARQHKTGLGSCNGVCMECAWGSQERLLGAIQECAPRALIMDKLAFVARRVKGEETWEEVRR